MRAVFNLLFVAVLAFLITGCSMVPTGVRSASVDLKKKSASYSSDTRTPEQIKADVAAALAGPATATTPAPPEQPAQEAKP